MRVTKPLSNQQWEMQFSLLVFHHALSPLASFGECPSFIRRTRTAAFSTRIVGRAPKSCAASSLSSLTLSAHPALSHLESFSIPSSCDSYGSSYIGSSGRRKLLFMSSISFLLPPHSLAETSDAAKLLTIQNSLRDVLSKAKAAGMLRLAFHDAGTYDMEDHSGGMNGSILYELGRPENTGLNKSIKILEKAKREIDKILEVSWADLIAVGGAEAVFLCGGPAISVKVGRLDVRKPDQEGKLPQETLDASGLKNCFQRKGFYSQELVALSGAHTLGSKGFGNPNVFDNAYYKILLEKPWTSSDSMSSMIGLPSDHSLADDDECLRWIKVYAGDQVKFFDDFASAYVKLVDSGAVWSSDKV